MKDVKLNNGVIKPVIGLGTFPMQNAELIEAVINSIKCGYIAFDTAAAYKNEESLGKALQLCNKKREEIFITTKLSNEQQRQGDVRQALTRSLEFLSTGYVDLYLIHWPNPDTFLDSWKQMEVLYKEGLCRAIGVSNFHQHHLEALLNIADIVPAVNQIELHPLLSQKLLINYCKSKEILIEAYSPLARMDERLIRNPILVSIAKKYHKNVVQTILRWNLQNGVISTVKTSSKDRLKSNIDIFDFNLSFDDMKKSILLIKIIGLDMIQIIVISQNYSCNLKEDNEYESKGFTKNKMWIAIMA